MKTSNNNQANYDCTSISGSDFYDETSMDMEDGKRKNRNMSEKKRRDQFNILINELGLMVGSHMPLSRDSKSPKNQPSQSHVGLVTSTSSQISYVEPRNLYLKSSKSCQGKNYNKKLDKSTILRITIEFLKTRKADSKKRNKEKSSNDIKQDDETFQAWKPSYLSHDEFAYLMMEAFDAFILVVDANKSGTNKNGNLLYASESILSLLDYKPSRISSCISYSNSNNPNTHSFTSEYFSYENEESGMTKITSSSFSMPDFETCPHEVRSLNMASTTTDASQVEKRISVYDIISKGDRKTFQSLLECESMTISADSHFISTNVYFRRNHSKPPVFELVRLIGSFNSVLNQAFDGLSGRDVSRTFISIGKLSTPKIMKELKLSQQKNNEFASRHSLEWKFLFLDHRASNLIGYMPFEVLGTSGYDYYHWDDLSLIASGHEQLIQEGFGTSGNYRFLTKGQHWVWLQTKYSITYHQWNSKPEFIVCTHKVTGYDDDEDGKTILGEYCEEEKEEANLTSVTSDSVKKVLPRNDQSQTEEVIPKPKNRKKPLDFPAKKSNKNILWSLKKKPETRGASLSSINSSSSPTASSTQSSGNLLSHMPSSSRHHDYQGIVIREDANTRYTYEELISSQSHENEEVPSEYPFYYPFSGSCPNNFLTSIDSITNLDEDRCLTLLSSSSSGYNNHRMRDLLKDKHIHLLKQIHQQQEELKSLEEQMFLADRPGDRPADSQH